tara:strand:- start:1443 stop:1886 length:444 start_codon:yes stop_codon:yes gene_type:complete
MKKIMTLLFIGLISLSIKAQEKTETVVDTNAPVFEFETDVIDYGKIEQNADGLRVFKFKNVGKSPLVISKVQSSCGCTVPKKPEAPIMPGATGEIEVKYATNRLGGFNKTITIFSNATEPNKQIRIKGIVLNVESPVVKQKSSVSSN